VKTLRLPDARGHFPALHDGASARLLEQQCLRACPPHSLMAAAGLAVAQLAQALCPHGRHVWVLVGPGNNGGDGLVAATVLQNAGWTVELCLSAGTTTRPADARWALAQCHAASVLTAPWPAAPSQPPDLVIDALLGRGQSRAPQGDVADMVAAITQWADRGVPVLAVDLPTGLCGDTGRTLGPVSVQASVTLALLSCAPGLFTAQGRDAAGQVWFAPLMDTPIESGVAPTARLAGPPDWHSAAPARLHAQHKGSFGDLWVVGGAPGMGGAVSLAARAALAAGAGRVFLSALHDTPLAPDPIWPEVMQRASSAWQARGVLEQATVVCGCGGGDAVRHVLPAVLARSARLVLDADALNAVSTDPGLRKLLCQRKMRGQATVLTPHPLEAARLLGCTVAQVQASRLAQAQTLAEDLACVVLLKGSGSVIAAPGQLPVLNPSGNARLATPGSGDVLAGWLGGLWSQGATVELPERVQQISAAAAWSHGAAAEGASPGPTLRGPLPASALITALQQFAAQAH
jgi:ADP-dependent NAD(P)H-hydrate dehydratase / NAD(P)H-hydrate epimerase